jgi:hypothetical protein
VASVVFAVAGLIACLGQASPVAAQAPASASQLFEVYVPPRLSGRVAIQGPVNVRIFHDGTNNDQTFADQRWDVGCNNARGARVEFETRRAFRLTGGGAPVKRDARIELGIASSEAPAGWAVTVPVAQTNYAAGNAAERVSVRAESFAPGDATFNLRVHFITDDFTTLRQGDYHMQVVGTISAK